MPSMFIFMVALCHVVVTTSQDVDISSAEIGYEGFIQLNNQKHREAINITKMQSRSTSTDDDPDSLTVMIFNTYLLKIKLILQYDAAPNVEQRWEYIKNWFNTLESNTVPDVLVLNEIYSASGDKLVRGICGDEFKRHKTYWGNRRRQFVPCESSSNFGYTTHVNNPTFVASPIKCGGVVVLVKKGIVIEHALDDKFTNLVGLDKFGNKGFWVVRFRKGDQRYYVVGLHALSGKANAELRVEQFQQIRTFMNQNIEDGARVVFAGDMNTNTDPFTDNDGHLITQNETDDMLNTLGSSNAAASGGTFYPNGFWLTLNRSLDYTWDSDRNHFVHHLPSEDFEGNQMYDWVLVPGQGDKFTAPVSMKRQVVPVLRNTCFASDYGADTDDLSDHYGVFASICYKQTCNEPAQVTGHRGCCNEVPSAADCP